MTLKSVFKWSKWIYFFIIYQGARIVCLSNNEDKKVDKSFLYGFNIDKSFSSMIKEKPDKENVENEK